jgi:hypothetical protein
MNLDELRPILHGYRKQLETAWSPATAHEDYEGKQGDPTGQCGVTSAWLQRRLAEDHGITAIYCGGHVWLVGQCVGPDHCWLEIGDGPDRLVVDLTADQLRGMSPWPVVCSAYGQLLMGFIKYQSHRWLTSDELAGEPVQARLSILTEALS